MKEERRNGKKQNDAFIILNTGKVSFVQKITANLDALLVHVS